MLGTLRPQGQGVARVPHRVSRRDESLPDTSLGAAAPAPLLQGILQPEGPASAHVGTPGWHHVWWLPTSWEVTAGPGRAGNMAVCRHVGMGKKIQPGSELGEEAHPTSPGEPWTTLGTEGCGTSVRGHRLHICGSFWRHPHPPPAPAHPMCTGKGAQLCPGTWLPPLSSPLGVSKPGSVHPQSHILEF